MSGMKINIVGASGTGKPTFLVAQIKVIRESPDLVKRGLARKLVKQKERRFRGRG